MKISIRRGVFETNSSNEHSLTVMRKCDYEDWKNGKCLAKCTSIEHDEKSCGNFDSYMYSFIFTEDFELAKRENQELAEEVKNERISHLNKWKDACMNYVPKVKKILTTEEYNQLSDEEQDKYEDDYYEDSLYVFDEKEYNETLERYNNISTDNVADYTSEGIWQTYDEFIDNFKLDCYSMFYHEIPHLGIIVFGKYFHS